MSEGEGAGDDQEETGGKEGQGRVLHCGGGKEHQDCQDDEKSNEVKKALKKYLV